MDFSILTVSLLIGLVLIPIVVGLRLKMVREEADLVHKEMVTLVNEFTQANTDKLIAQAKCNSLHTAIHEWRQATGILNSYKVLDKDENDPEYMKAQDAYTLSLEKLNRVQKDIYTYLQEINE